MSLPFPSKVSSALPPSRSTCEIILAPLDAVRRQGSGWTARCPVHDDRNPSLSIKQGEDGRALVYASAALGPYKIAGITVRKTRTGRLAISYPKRTAGDGTAHTYFLPTDPEVRSALEADILTAFRQRKGGRS